MLARSKAHRDRTAWELPVEFLPALAARCREVGVQFACTPFYMKAVEELRPHVDFYKIASYELLWDDLLTACARTGKPVVLSTGMAVLDEIRRAVKVLRDAGCSDLTVLHAISGYPTPVEECNLSAIETLREACACSVGWSDHSASAAVLYRAVLYHDASMVEFHLDLDGTGDEYKTGHCWLPGDAGQVIRTIRASYQADGTGEKLPVPSELADREWRADPSDGLRPLLEMREAWRG